MANWKPIGSETWRKRKRRYPVSGSAWWMPGHMFKAPLEPKIEGYEIQTFGPGALYDCVVFRPVRDESSFEVDPTTALRFATIADDPESLLIGKPTKGKTGGRWVDCTPELLDSRGPGFCATALRRPGPPCPFPALAFSHQHWVV